MKEGKERKEKDSKKFGRRREMVLVELASIVARKDSETTRKGKERDQQTNC